MDLKTLLDEIIRIKGLTAVALVGDDGFVIESAAAPGTTLDLDFLGGVASSSLASSQALAEFFGKGEVTQTLIEFEEGPVLLTPVSDRAHQYVVLATLDSAQNLGRVRFQLKKYLPRLLEAAQA
jgi:predicted regulator of Ras-like GTPase activity (Roadblock/LC7/MglB family)